MIDWEKRIKDILEGELRPNQRAFVVEGGNDTSAYKLLFRRKLDAVDPNWIDQWHITHGNKKSNVLDILRAQPTWLGLVDKDEWTDEEIAQYQQELPNLLVLPRFTMENYLIVPDELWGAFSDAAKNRIPDGLPILQQRLTQGLDQWVRHGALWSVINPLWRQIRSLGFQDSLLQTSKVPDDAEVLEKLQQWHQFLEPSAIMKKFQDCLTTVNKLPTEEKLAKWVHGKKYWSQIVVPLLNELLSEQKDKDKRRIEIWRTLPIPSDWDPIWDKLQNH